MDGWIKLHRRLLNWEWYKKENMVHLFIHLLLSANHENGKWQGIEIKRGQVITGRKSLSKETGISQQSIRTCIERLKSTNEITIQSTNKYSVITLCNYESYQNEKIKSTSKSTSTETTSNHQSTTNKNNKNEEEIKEVYIFSKTLFEEKYINQAWEDCIRKLIEIDGYESAQIMDVIKWARTDDFWKKNFISPLKLRNKDKDGVKYFDKFKANLPIKKASDGVSIKEELGIGELKIKPGWE